MNLSRRSLLSAFTLLPAAHWLRGQQAPPAPAAAPPGQQPPTAPVAVPAAPGQPPPTYSAEVKVVNIFATVRDKKGQIVKDLNKEDFVLDEEGHPQVIRYFARETDLPLTLGLLVDTSGSQRNVLNDERDASRRFFDQVLREDRDLAFLIHFDKEVELLEDLTPSREKLQKALDELQVTEPQLQRQRGGGYPPDDGSGSGGGRRGGGTHLYDAVKLAADELMMKQKGRKALVLLTDGVDRGSRYTLFEAISAAQHADTLVYSILFAGSYGYGNGGLRPRHGTAPRRDGLSGRLSRWRLSRRRWLSGWRRLSRPRRIAATARRCWSRWRARPAAGLSRCRTTCPSTRYSPRSKKSSAASTASATPPTKPAKPRLTATFT